jgi:propionate catabolism operon transcriptional regulator
LKNVIERISVLYEEGVNHTSLLTTILRKNAAASPSYPDIDEIHKVLKEVRGNKTEAARRLGISRTSLWRKLNS